MTEVEKIRYCENTTYFLGSCDVGWGTVGVGSDGKNIYKSCHDEPKEQNCLCLVNKPKEVRESKMFEDAKAKEDEFREWEERQAEIASENARADAEIWAQEMSMPEATHWIRKYGT